MKTSMKKTKRLKKSSQSQITTSTLLLIKAMEERPGLSANKLCPAYPTYLDQKKAWASIAHTLNTNGMTNNHSWTAFGARKKWADLKYKIRKKAMAIEQIKKEGKMAVPPGLKLTPLEKRILALAPLKISRREPTPSTSSQNEDDPTCQITDDRTEQESPDTNDSAPDCSMEISDDRVENNDTKRTSRFQEELFSLQKSKLDIRKAELLLKKEKLELEKKEIDLMKQQLTVQTNTLNELKTMCRLMGKKKK